MQHPKGEHQEARPPVSGWLPALSTVTTVTSLAKPTMRSAHRNHRYPHKPPSFGLELCSNLCNALGMQIRGKVCISGNTCIWNLRFASLFKTGQGRYRWSLHALPAQFSVILWNQINMTPPQKQKHDFSHYVMNGPILAHRLNCAGW